MLTILVPGIELYNEKTEKFEHSESFPLELEHSLVSVSKWESIFEKPFLGKDEKSDEEILAYINCMILTPEVPPEVFGRMTEDNHKQISDYINAKMTATWFSEQPNSKPSTEVVTNELVYYWMFSYRIPIECQDWHLNRLLTLIRVFHAKQVPEKKGRPTNDDLARRRALNEQRKAKMNTRG